MNKKNNFEETTLSVEKWVSFHIYFNGPVNNFLKDIFFPLIEKLRSDNLFSKYFFIRYNESGQHIRFRAYSNREKELLEHITNFFNDFKKTGQPEIQFISCLPAAYVPEIERYGGLSGIGPCEDFFCNSSELVANRIIEYDDFDTADAIAIAVSLHMYFLHTLEIPYNHAEYFFETMMISWIKSSESFLNSYKKNGGANVESLEIYEKSYESQKDVIAKVVAEVIDSINGKSPVIWLSRYKRALLSLKESMDLSFSVGRFYTAASLMHMSNNRLGLSNMDESFLYYVLLKSLKQGRFWYE